MHAVKKKRWFSLIPVLLAVLLFAGMFSLMAPTAAQAAGGDVEITGPGLNGDGITITQSQLRGTAPLSDGTYLAQQDVIYSTINTWPTKGWYRGQGVKLTDLLNLAGGLKPEATLIRFTAGDGFKTTFTVQEFVYAPRYIFPNFMDTGIYGHIPGDPSGAVPVDAIIAHRSFSTNDYADTLDDDNFGRSDANHLLFGQRAVTQQTNSRFAKYVVKIEVLTDSVPKWDNPTANPGPGVVPAGTMVELSSLFNDEDKVHYTLDGSVPTIESPMYNRIASRWWSSRADDLDEINHPVEIKGNTTIKAFVTGPGRSDSDIVTFEYQVNLADPPALTSDTSGNTIGQAVDITFTDDADWWGAITDITVNGTSIAGQYTVTAGNINIAAGVFTATGDYEIIVSATGYTDAAVTQTMVGAPVVLTAAFTADPASGTAPLTVSFTDQSTGTAPLTYEWDFDNDGTVDSGEQNPTHVYSTAGTYSVKLTVINADGSDNEVKTDYITVNSTPPSTPPTLTADTTENRVGQAIDITFTDDAEWHTAITDITVNGTSIAGQYAVTGGNINIAAGVFTAAGDYSIVVKATGYSNAPVTQTIESAIEFVVVDGVLTAYLGAGGDVVIPDNLGITAIGDAVFKDLTTLTSVTIPEGVTGIGAEAFRSCSNLASITIPEGVTSIGSSALRDCSSLTPVIIPEGVTSVGAYAFRGCSSLTSMVIPESVTSIENYTFYGCSKLSSVSISGSITSIGENAFRNCSSLSSITIPEGTTGIGDNAFRGCGSMTSITIPGSVSSIGDNAFNGCSGLNSVSISNGAGSIGNSAFRGCSSLTSITIPGSVSSIGSSVFLDCSSLSSVSISDGVSSIGSSAFSGCSNLTSINIPSSITRIPEQMFQDCTSLSSLTIPDSVTDFGNYAFWNCGSLSSFAIPDGVTSIRAYVFQGCISLTSITIPDNVTSIGEKAFRDCISLASITIPASVTSIGTDAFLNCDNLTIYGYAGSYAETYAASNTIPFVAIDGTPAPALTADTADNTVGQAVDITFTDDADWWGAITDITVNGTSIAGQYTVTAGNINIAAGVFTTAGDYAVVVKATGYSDAAMTQTMLAAAVAPVADFTANPTSGAAPLTVQFTDQSTNSPTSWAWDFENDGSTDSTEQNPAYTYEAAGIYSVKLTVTNSAGSDDEVKTGYITVNPAYSADIKLISNYGITGVTTFITGSGFDAGTSGTVWFDTNDNGVLDDGEPSVSVNTDADGAIPSLTSLTVPSASAGSYTVYADIPSGDGIEAAAGFTITDSGIIVNPTSGNARSSSYINVNGIGFAPSTNYRLFCDRNGNGVFDDGAYKSGNTTANGTLSVTNLSWPASPQGIYNILLDIGDNGTMDASAGIAIIPSIYISTPRGVPGTNIGINIDGYPANATGYVWFDTNGNGIWDEGENRASVTTSSAGSATSPGLIVPSVAPGPYQVYAEIPTGGVKTSATYSVRGIILDPGSGTAGTTIGITGYGFNTNQTSGRYIWFDTNGNGAWDAEESKVDVTTDANGVLSPVSLTAPAVPAGAYNVCAYVFPVGTFSVFTLNYTPPEAAFTADPTSGAAPLTVQFTDQSTNSPTSWAWDFDNDSVVDSTYQNPAYTYYAAGTYTVKLTVTNADGSDDGVKTDYITVSAASAMDVLYDGTVNLTPNETFEVTAYNSGTKYTVYETTPLGALQAAATVSGFTYAVTDKNYTTSGALLLDDVGSYIRKTPGYWYAYVNDVYKDGYNNAPGALNLIELVNGDRVEFYYAAGIADATDLNAVKTAATAAVKTVASTGVTPTDWTLQLSGAKNQSVTKAYFEEGLACSSSGHQVTWTDEDNNVWGGVPLWLLVGMVDDNPDVGPAHFNFNDELAAQNYEVNVIAGDGWKATLDSAAIARNDGYIVANTLNGEPLPLQTEGGKGCWPLYLKGSAVFGGQQVGNIVRIELSGLPEPPEGWTLELTGDIGDTITQEEFEEGLACTGSGHLRQWTDIEGNVWSGVPLWVLLGAVDDIEKSSHWTFNDTLATAGYTVIVVAGDGFSRSFDGAVIARSDDYIVANKVNGADLTDAWPLRLVGNGVKKADGSLGGSAVGKIAKIEIPELMTPEAAPDSWNLVLNGKISDVISQAEFEDAIACPNSGHYVEWTDVDGNKWSGIPLWFLAGWVDDRQPHDYDYNQAMAGYTVLVKAGDGYTKDFDGVDIAKSNDYIIANKINGEPLAESSKPLRLVGAGVTRADGTLSGTSVGNIAEIELTAFNTVKPIPELRIVKYAEDRTTIIDEITVDYQWMENESGLDVIGDGTTVYRYEGITNNPDDVWDADETYPGGYKIANAVKGTRIKDLCELVGGMGAGTEIILVAGDGFETRLPYSSIYPDPSVQERQGDAILAWWADGEYVPYYKDGMRLFFTPDDHIYGQWDMHETLPENYWHYYYGDGVQYPSCAGLSAKYIEEIKIYSVPAGDWTLELDGRDIGGLQYDVSKTYFEQALACQFGANHKATYTDSEGRVWEGMPLWFLAGFVDDADQHSDNAFNDALAAAGYQVVITAADDHSVTVDSADIIRNSDYIVANTLNGAPIPETDSNWPLRLVGPAASGATSISQIERIDLVSQAGPKPVYTVTPVLDDAYTAGTTEDGTSTMSVNAGISGFKHFTVSITPVDPVNSHNGDETVVFTHLRNGSQLQINATIADFDQVNAAQAGFNVEAGDVIKVFIVNELTNAKDHNPVILQ